MNETFNIFNKLSDDINDFDEGGYYIVGEPKSEVNYKQSQKGKNGGYYYSQKETLESIDLASASKFKKGPKDKQGERKAFINIVNFYRDVMKMKININVANYIFEPESLDFTWPVWLMAKKFGIWAREESYDDQIDEYGHDMATYGSTVAKKTRDCTERVPLRTLRNTPSAKSLKHAAMTGGYVIIEDDKHYNEMVDYKKWNLSGLAKNKSFNTFEYYTLVPEDLYQNWQESDGECEFDEDTKMIPCQIVLIPDEKDKDNKRGKICWMEKITEDSFPLEESHAEKVDGRWLGRGEIEKQLENQIARNLSAHLRRRGLLWATKKVYQSSDDEVKKNLIMEVEDGEVLKVKANGLISQVNTANQHLGEFQSDENMWKENSQQIAFAFNIATGENMPSGTSFSLGVVLEKAVSDHFTMVRNTFSNFLIRSFFNQILDIFREEYSGAHSLQFPMGATDIENLQDAMITYHANLRYFDRIVKRKPMSMDDLRAEVAQEMYRNPYLFVEIPDDFYPKAHYYMRLNIDQDIGPDIQTLTTLYQAMIAKGDPRADLILKRIFAKQGKSFDQLAGRVGGTGGGAFPQNGGNANPQPEARPEMRTVPQPLPATPATAAAPGAKS